ncbi:MAG: glycosyltransferase family 4 protein [Gammaproteobacteria bacterium]
MRVLIVTRNLPPLVGGMEQLNWHLADELTKYAEVQIIGPPGSAALAPANTSVREVPLTPLPRFLLSADARARYAARHWQPDVVLAGSGLTAPVALRAARTCKAKSAVYVHGLDVVVKSFLYRHLWLPALRRADRVIANSHATAELCRERGVDAARVGIVYPGVTLPAHAATHEATAHFRAEQGLSDGPLLLSVGRLTARKGLREFVVQCLPRIVAKHPDATLLVVGDAPKQSLHARTQTPASIQTAADTAGVGKHLHFAGVITDRAQLATIYQAADVHVFPVREIAGDPEGFGMVAVEAAAHGLPTVAFATGGVADAVAAGQSGYLVPPGDYTAFGAAVLRTLDAQDMLRNACMRFAQQFAWPAFGQQIARELGLTEPASHKSATTP